MIFADRGVGVAYGVTPGRCRVTLGEQAIRPYYLVPGNLG